MQLTVVTPGAVVVDEPVAKVTAEAIDGSFTLLPRHVDIVTILVSGLVVHVEPDTGTEHVLAVDGGVLVKRRRHVRIATPGAIAGDSVIELQHAMRSSFRELTDHERQSRAALARLETDAVRRLLELEERV